jgi:nitroimidazol reductase NimA-like FMN-containing flavoprotein (pyridoxamine 5'-phosphate oxidase superfamily)
VDTPIPAPDKMDAPSILALLNRAAFGRLATYAPPHGAQPGHCYVVPLQFLHKDGILYLITTAGRKLANLRAAPSAVCFALDVTDGRGWTSICAWGTYGDVTDRLEQLRVTAAAFDKYPEGTTKQAVSLLRSITPGSGHRARARAGINHNPVFGRIALRSMAGRRWGRLRLPAGTPLLRTRPAPPATSGRRGPPIRLDRAGCDALLAARPLARLGCYDRARQRAYCLPMWYIGDDESLWFYQPMGGTLLDALRTHPQGVCAQVDDLDCSPDADPTQPWRSVLAEGSATVYTLGPDSLLPVDRQVALLRAIRARLERFAIRSPFIPPDPSGTLPPGALIRLRVETLAGQATGALLP